MISIVIPVFNEERYIGKCLNSLENQNFKDFEVIVVDDGSTDRSAEIVKRYSVRLLRQRHKGPGAARNLGANESLWDRPETLEWRN